MQQSFVQNLYEIQKQNQNFSIYHSDGLAETPYREMGQPDHSNIQVPSLSAEMLPVQLSTQSDEKNHISSNQNEVIYVFSLALFRIYQDLTYHKNML